MLRYTYNDDGWFQRGYRIYDNDVIYADTENERDAIEIIHCVNAMREDQEGKVGETICEHFNQPFECKQCRRDRDNEE
jgi:hypothetical protein